MQHIGRETQITVGDKVYTLARFTRKLTRKYLDWCESILPSPIENIKGQLEGFSLHLQEIMVKDAVAAARLKRSMQSPDVQSLMATPEGSGKIITLLLQEHQPNLSEDDTWDVFEAARREHGDNYMQAKIAEAGGIPPEELKALLADDHNQKKT